MRSAAALVVLVLVACRGTPPPPVAPPAKLAVVATASPGPLIAAHATAVCSDCHVGSAPEVPNEKCLGCHEHGGLRARITAGRGFHASAGVRGKLCTVCHSDHKGPGFSALGWKTVRGGQKGFDHDLTGWTLAGPHARTSCESCHTGRTPRGNRTFLAADRLCGACHKQQPHAFERRDMLACERCHDTGAWSPPKRALQFDHDDRKDAAMPLIGAHRKVACVACHAGNQFNSPTAQPQQCESCHVTPHAGQAFGKLSCATCHTEYTFKPIAASFDHAERTKFDTGASHRHIECVACHTPALRDKPPSSACESCHAARGPHRDRFKAFGKPPACATCHAPTTQFDPRTRAPLLPWKPNAFDHAKHTKWPLTGKHAQKACRQCHRGKDPAQFERFASGTDCMGCHEHSRVHADAAHPKGKFTNVQCASCHFP